MSEKFRVAQAEWFYPGAGASTIEGAVHDLTLWEGNAVPTHEELIEVALAAPTEPKGGNGAPEFTPDKFLKVQERTYKRIGGRAVWASWKTVEKKAIDDLRAQATEAL